MGYFLLCPVMALLFFLQSITPILAATPSVNVVLGRPTDTSITLNCLAPTASKVRAEYGTEANSLNQKEIGRAHV